MRTKLKFAIIGLASLAGVSGLNEAARAQSLDEILECRSIAADLERLRCFDDTSEPAEGAQSANAEADGDSRSLAKVASSDPQSPEYSFGAEDLPQIRKESGKGLNTLRAKLVGLGFTQSGRYMITLDNGQVWRQITGDTDRLYLPNASDGGIPIIIKRGLLGSHMLRPISSKRSIRVERIK